MLNRTEFGRICGLGKNSRNAVASYIKRGQLVEVDGLLDPKDKLNALFLIRHGVTDPTTVVVRGDAPKRGAKKKAVMKIAPLTAAETASVKRATDRFSLDTKKKEADIRRIERETTIQDIRLGKLMGQLLPTDLIRTFIAQLFKGQQLANKNAIDQLVTSITKKAKLNRNDMAEIRTDLTTILNRSVQDAITETRKQVDSIVQEFSTRSKSA